MKAPSSPARHIVAFVLLAAASQAGCHLLLRLSEFGQNPFSELPLPMILMFGALASGPLESLSRSWSRRLLLIATAAAVAANLGLFVLSEVYGSSPVEYLAAPLAALVLTLAFRALRPELGEMLSAMTVFVVATVLANYTFDSFIPVGPFFLVNVGTFFFGITFTQRDRVHKFGRRKVYAMIAAAAAANVLMALHLGTPMRYVLVGFLAIVLSESADTEVYARLLHRRWLTRVASSNAVSAPLDTLIFTILAFGGEEFATFGWMVQVILTDIGVKYASGMVAALQMIGTGRGRLETGATTVSR